MRTSKRVVLVLGLVLATASPGSLVAQATAYPEFTGERVYVAGTDDIYSAALRATILRVEKTSPRTYYAVVVRSSGHGQLATRDYIDALWTRWLTEARRSHLPLDPSRSVVVLLALENRQLSVHGGTVLQSEYNLRGQTIDREIVAPHFIPHARAGDYLTGMTVLIAEIERWLVQKDEQRKRERDVKETPREQDLEPAPREQDLEPAPREQDLEAAPRERDLKETPGERDLEDAPGERDPKGLPDAGLPDAGLADTESVSDGDDHPFLTRTLPLSAAGAGLLIGLATIGLLVFRHARTRRAARARLETLEQRAVAFLDQLDELRKRYELLPYSDPDFKEPMTGATLALYESVDKTYTELRQRWLSLMETRESCAHLLATERMLGTKNARQALRLLEEARITGENESEYDACNAALDRLEGAHEAVAAALESLENAMARLREQLEAIRRDGLPTSPYDPDVAFCASARDEARAALDGDPIGARGTLEQTLEKVVGIGRWTERIIHDLAGAEEARLRLDKAADVTREHRASGMLLTEKEGDPDPPIARGRDEHAAARRALERGDAEVSARHIEAAFGAADRALDILRRQVAAREFCARELPARRSESARLRDALAGARSARTKLEWSFAADSWNGVAENPRTAESILDSLDPTLDDAEAAGAVKVQHYFHAADLLTHIGEQHRRVDSLLTAVDDRLGQLQELAERCAERRGELDGRAAELDDFVAAYEAIVGEDATRLVKTLATLARECDDEIKEDRPDWPAVARRLDQIDEGLAAARTRAENDVRLHGRLLARLEEVGARARDVGRLLASSSADRARANLCHREANAALERLTRDASAPRSDWQAMLDRLQGVAEDLERSEMWAREDIQLARQAEAAIRDAERAYQRARGFLRAGVAADVSTSGSLLQQSREALERQAYEGSIDTATQAERSAREAYDEAVSEARRVEARRERARRRAEARRRTSSSSSGFAFGSTGEHSSFGSSFGAGFGSSFSSGSSSSSFSSGSSSSSWSSGSSQSSW